MLSSRCSSSLSSLSFFSLLLLPALAHPPFDKPAKESLEAIVVEGKAQDLSGSTLAASAGEASARDLAARPLLRRGEMLEVIPGMVVTQHAGGGKANQYFLRGFNLDHGTDFATSLEGMPLNMRSHSHGQGYTDLNPLITEMVESLNYHKGSYAAQQGDMSSAGSADFRLWDALPKAILRTEVGSYNYYRAMAAGSIRFGEDPGQAISQGITAAMEGNYYDGPWSQGEESQRYNGLLRYFKSDPDTRLAVTLLGYQGVWSSTDQIPLNGLNDGTVDRYGSMDRSTGGSSQRYSLHGLFEHRDEDVVTKASAYVIQYGLDLYSNFSYLTEEGSSAQFNQFEQRWVAGGELARTWEKRDWFGVPTQVTVGTQLRSDWIDGIGLWNTSQREVVSRTRQDDLQQHSLGVYFEVQNSWASWFRTVSGLRADGFLFDTRRSSDPGQDDAQAALLSPKFSAIFGPWNRTEAFFNLATGFHSNDARGVMASQQPADALVRTLGGEVGVRTSALEGLTSAVALYWLRSDSELVYVGDEGRNEPGPASQRYGVEISNYWRPTSWFSLDGEAAFTQARLDLPAGQARHIPNSVPIMLSAGMTLGAQGDKPGWFSSLRLRSFANSPLNEGNTAKSRDSLLVNASVGLRGKDWEVAADVLNLLDRQDWDIAYFYGSRHRVGGAEREGIHFHPIEPRMLRLRVTKRF